MKIGLVLQGNIYFSPFIKIYTKILDGIGAEYDLIYWDRDGINEAAAYRYPVKVKRELSDFMKLFYYFRYSRFVIHSIKKENYDKLIIFGPQIGIFLYSFLKQHYMKKFIFDYRDLSIEQKLKAVFRKLLDISQYQVISSPGFKKYLPVGYNYIISHNVDIDLLKSAIRDVRLEPYKLALNEGLINVLTIGGIRDYEQNREVIDSLGNKDGIIVSFVGKGDDSLRLKNYSNNKHFANVAFVGFYKKEEESCYIEKSTFMNIYYPRRPSHDTALSNRFYNSIIYRRPMITTSNTIQGNYASKFNIGLAINNCDNLYEKINEYLSKFDSSNFEKNRSSLLNSFLEDYNTFNRTIKSFILE